MTKPEDRIGLTRILHVKNVPSVKPEDIFKCTKKPQVEGLLSTKSTDICSDKETIISRFTVHIARGYVYIGKEATR